MDWEWSGLPIRRFTRSHKSPASTAPTSMTFRPATTAPQGTPRTSARLRGTTSLPGGAAPEPTSSTISVQFLSHCRRHSASIEFDITTGGDDLRGDSSATVSLRAPNGSTMSTFTLKAENAGSWDNNSVHNLVFPLSSSQPASAFGSFVITLTSHNGTFETDDNWNIQDLGVRLVNTNGSEQCIVSLSGDPLTRLTGSGPKPIVRGPQRLSIGSWREAISQSPLAEERELRRGWELGFWCGATLDRQECLSY